MNPLGVDCEKCATPQAHDTGLLLSYSVDCIACGTRLKSAGRAMHASMLKSNVFFTKVCLLLSLEEEFGAPLEMDDGLEEASTLVQFMDHAIAISPQLTLRAHEARAAAVLYMREWVPCERETEVEKQAFEVLLASDPEPEP